MANLATYFPVSFVVAEVIAYPSPSDEIEKPSPCGPGEEYL
jgi:hypothetical protein